MPDVAYVLLYVPTLGLSLPGRVSGMFCWKQHALSNFHILGYTLLVLCIPILMGFEIPYLLFDFHIDSFT